MGGLGKEKRMKSKEKWSRGWGQVGYGFGHGNGEMQLLHECRVVDNRAFVARQKTWVHWVSFDSPGAKHWPSVS